MFLPCPAPPLVGSRGAREEVGPPLRGSRGIFSTCTPPAREFAGGPPLKKLCIRH